MHPATAPPTKNPAPKSRALALQLGALACILVLGGVFRFWQIGSYPQGIHYDEVLNGLRTRALLHGRPPPLLTADSAREPLIFYLMAGPLWLLGPTPGALRLATATGSLLLVLGVFLLARALFGTKAALLTALICATTVWPIYHGRLATRPVILPLLLSFALYVGILAWRSQKKRHWALAGLLFGAVFYTYSSNFFVIPTLILTVLGLGIYDKQALAVRKWQLLGTAALIVAIGLPIFAFRANMADTGFTRPRELAVFYPGQSLLDTTRTMVIQTGLIARMFIIKGDENATQNIPNRAVFDVLMALPFILGGVIALSQPKLRPGALLCIMWLGIWLAPSWLSKSAPNFLRINGILIVLFIWPALGLRWLYQTLSDHAGQLAGLLVAAAILGGSILITTRDYILSDFLASPEIYSAYHGPSTAPSLAINQQLQTGWLGDNVAALPAPDNPPTLAELEVAAGELPAPFAQYLIPWLFDPPP